MKLSKISMSHFLKLIFRSVLFLFALALYVADRLHVVKQQTWVLALIWAVFMVEMVLRFFPSPTESMGCQKQFSKNYIPVDAPRAPHKGILAVILSWVVLNGGIAALYYTHIIDAGILFLIALFYSVCDMICILFYCPFQTLMMKNKCCTTCRIYNWDFAMMFTPLLFVRNFYTITLVLASLVLLIRWEVTALKHPEYFSEEQNAALHCRNCKEKLCHHKTQLQTFLKNRKK